MPSVAAIVRSVLAYIDAMAEIWWCFVRGSSCAMQKRSTHRYCRSNSRTTPIASWIVFGSRLSKPNNSKAPGSTETLKVFLCRDERVHCPAPDVAERNVSRVRALQLRYQKLLNDIENQQSLSEPLAPPRVRDGMAQPSVVLVAIIKPSCQSPKLDLRSRYRNANTRIVIGTISRVQQ